VIEAAFSTPIARHWIETKMPAADGDVCGRRAVGRGPAVDERARGRRRLVHDITERKSNEERLSYLARYDQLTGCRTARCCSTT